VRGSFNYCEECVESCGELFVVSIDVFSSNCMPQDIVTLPVLLLSVVLCS
jgi:hypothetical protein